MSYCIDKIKAELDNKGWIYIKNAISTDLCQFLQVKASELGNIVEGDRGTALCQELKPTKKENAYLHSLSSKYGLEAFPLHNDTAHWIHPVRYILLGCINANGSQPTLLLDTNSIHFSMKEKELVMNTPFLIKNGRNSFYGKILAKDRKFIRFDASCMKAVNSNGEEVFKLYNRYNHKKYLKEINWKTNSILILDNWRILHGRGKPAKNNRERKLLRVFSNDTSIQSSSIL